MTKVRRLLAVAAVLALTAISTTSILWGEPAPKNRGIKAPDEGSKPASKEADPVADLAKAKFARGGVLTYLTKDNELLFALQAKHSLKTEAARPREVLVMVNTSASLSGAPLIAARQITEEIVAAAGPKDRVSIWTISTDDPKFTRNLTNGFRSSKVDKKIFDRALAELKAEYPAGGTDLKSGLEKAIKSFEGRDERSQVILYLGNGRSIEPISAAERADLCAKMVDKQIGFFPVPLGSNPSPENLHGMASCTGGLAVRIKMHELVADAVKRINEVMAQPIMYVRKLKVEGVKDFMPAQMPPLRPDAATLIVGRMTPRKTLDFTVEGIVDGKDVGPITITEKVPDSDLDNYFLIGLLDQWKQAKDQPALIRADRALVFAFEQNRLAREEALALAQMALKDNELDAAKQMFARARQIDPRNVEADAGLQIVANMKDGKLTRKQLEDELLKNGKGIRIEKLDGKVRLIRGQMEQLAQLGDKKPARAEAEPLDRDDLLRAHRDRVMVEEQKTGEAVDSSLRRARRILANDPEGAHDLLKRALLMVRDHPDLGERVRQGLINRLENTLRDVDMRGVQIRQRKDEQLRVRALAAQLYEAKVEQHAVEEKTRARLRVYRDMMNHARFEEATATALAIQQDALDAGTTTPVAATSGYQIAQTATHLEELRELRRRREAGFLNVMMQVERSHVPFADEPPVHFPPAAKWRELTRLHKHFESGGFSDQDEKIRIKALKLADMLNRPITLEKGIDANTPLKDALEYFSDHYDLTILIDTQAFKEENKEGDAADVEATPVKLPKMTNIALGTALRLLLSQVPPNGATYLIRRDFIEVTTGTRAIKEKTLRLYPVADLVIPIPNSINQQAVQQTISVFGTQAGLAGIAGVGGAFGGGLGGIGGIGGGLGGIGGIGGIGGGLGGIGGIGGIGGGLGGIGGGLGGIGGGLGGIGGGLGGIGGGLGGIGGGLGGIGGGLGGGIGGLGGGLGGIGGIGGGIGGGFGGQMGQFGNAGGQFGFQGRNQSGQLILLIRQVVGTPEDWRPLTGLNRGIGGFRPGGGLPIPDDDDKKDSDVNYYNDLGFFQPAMALVVKATSRIHTDLGGGLFGAKKGGPAEARNNLGNRERNGDLVIRPKGKRNDNDVQVANAGGERNPPKTKKVNGKMITEADAKKIWDDALAKGVNDPRLIIAVADFLAEVNKMDHAAEFLKANLRQGIVKRTWVYDALAIALEANGASASEIRRVRLSGVDLEPQDARGYLKAAKAMAEQKEWDRALAFCKQAAQLQPNVPHAYEDALVYAENRQDPLAMEWAAGNLLRKDWPVENQQLQLKAQAKLDALAAVLKKATKAEAATRMEENVSSLKQRDLVIHLTWAAGESGPADLDLEVKEPSGSKCSCLQRLTPGGGTLIGDTLTETNRETYIAAKGFSGDYEVTIHRIWGKPLGSKAKLVVITHQGTPEETRQEEVIRLDKKHTLTVQLAGGRRTSTAAVPTQTAYERSQTKEEDAGMSASKIMVKLRDLANPELGARPTIEGGVGSYGSSGRTAQEPYKQSKNDVAYQTKVSPFFPNSIDLTAQAVVSADRRYVRLSMAPVFQTVTKFQGGRLVNIPLIPGFVP